MRVHSMPYSLHEGCFWPMVAHNTSVFLPAPGRPSVLIARGGPWPQTVGPSCSGGLDRQRGRTERLAAAIHAQRPPSYRAHPLRDLGAQRLAHIAAGEADAKDAPRLRRAPVVTLGVARPPLEPSHAGARAPTCSRLEPHSDRPDL